MIRTSQGHSMSTKQPPAVTAYDTAYPGSMHERSDGYYVCRNDHASMAAALVKLIASRDREIENLRARVEYWHLETADKIIADYKEHYSFPPQGESHMHDCIVTVLDAGITTAQNTP